MGRTDLFQVFGLLNFRLEYILLEILTPSGEKCVVIQSLLSDTNLKEKGSNILGVSVELGSSLAWKELFAPWVSAELPVGERNCRGLGRFW